MGCCGPAVEGAHIHVLQDKDSALVENFRYPGRHAGDKRTGGIILHEVVVGVFPDLKKITLLLGPRLQVFRIGGADPYDLDSQRVK